MSMSLANNNDVLLKILEGDMFTETYAIEELGGKEITFRALSVTEMARLQKDARVNVKSFKKKLSKADTRAMMLSGEASIEMSAEEFDEYQNRLHKLLVSRTANIDEEVIERLPALAYAELVAYAHKINYLGSDALEDADLIEEVERFRGE